MKRILTSLLASAAVLAGCGPKFPTLSPADFETAVADTLVQLVDVRTPEEFAGTHIPRAVNMDVQAEDFLPNATGSLDPDRPVAVYCRGGRRSADAARKLVKAGFGNVLNLDGGITAWTEAGKTVSDLWDYIVFDGDMAPDFSMELVDAMKDYDPAFAGGQGPFVQLSDLRGKVVLLQFTASWCSVCRKEMPHLESRIWLRHNGDKDFEFIAVDRDEPIEKMLKFKEVTGITYPMAFDPQGQIFDKFALHDSGITRNVLLDRDGKIVYRTRLYDEEAFETLVSKVDSLLAR